MFLSLWLVPLNFCEIKQIRCSTFLKSNCISTASTPMYITSINHENELFLESGVIRTGSDKRRDFTFMKTSCIPDFSCRLVIGAIIIEKFWQNWRWYPTIKKPHVIKFSFTHWYSIFYDSFTLAFKWFHLSITNRCPRKVTSARSNSLFARLIVR